MGLEKDARMKRRRIKIPSERSGERERCRIRRKKKTLQGRADHRAAEEGKTKL